MGGPTEAHPAGGTGSARPVARVGLFELLEVLGEGATSRVHRARHLTLGTEHAVKVLRSDRIMARERFLAEGRALAILRHPNIVAVHAIVEEPDDVAIAMELVDGRNLEDWRRMEAPPVDERLRVFREIVAAVREIHRQGYVHRDLKPENVLMARVADAVVPKLGDLGIARRPGPPESRQTLSGVAMGTPRYMAPEQIRDAASADARADVFALGVLLYELLSDRLPFTALDLQALYESIRDRVYTPLDEILPDGHAGLSAVVDRMLSFDPADRPASCDEVLAHLPPTATTGTTIVPKAAGGDRRDPRRPPRLVPAPTRMLALGLVALALGVLGAGWSQRAASTPVPTPVPANLVYLECDQEPLPTQAPDPAPTPAGTAEEEATASLARDRDRPGRFRLFKKKDR
jgi:serine/threonine-protein kinase